MSVVFPFAYRLERQVLRFPLTSTQEIYGQASAGALVATSMVTVIARLRRDGHYSYTTV